MIYITTVAGTNLHNQCVNLLRRSSRVYGMPVFVDNEGRTPKIYAFPTDTQNNNKSRRVLEKLSEEQPRSMRFIIRLAENPKQQLTLIQEARK